MKRILIQRVGDIYLTVDISGVGMKAESLPSEQQKSKQELEKYLLSKGASQEQVAWVNEQLKTTINTILTI